MNRPGVVAVVEAYGRRLPLAECARCGRERLLFGRGLCISCRGRCSTDGTLSDYGYVKADRVAEYTWHRVHGSSVTGAAQAIGVTRRTATRYEAELRGCGNGGR